MLVNRIIGSNTDTNFASWKSENKIKSPRARSMVLDHVWPSRIWSWWASNFIITRGCPLRAYFVHRYRWDQRPVIDSFVDHENSSPLNNCQRCKYCYSIIGKQRKGSKENFNFLFLKWSTFFLILKNNPSKVSFEIFQLLIEMNVHDLPNFHCHFVGLCALFLLQFTIFLQITFI